MTEMVVFRTGGVHFAIERRSIGHIGPMPADAQAMLEGRRLRQRIVYEDRNYEVIDLAADLDQGASQPPPHNVKWVIGRDFPLQALRVDHIEGGLTVSAAQFFQLPPAFEGPVRACFPQVLRVEDKLVLVVDMAVLAAIISSGAHTLKRRQVRPSAAEERLSAGLLETVHPDGYLNRNGGSDLENLVMEKIKNIVTRRVRRILVRTILGTMERQSYPFHLRRRAAKIYPRCEQAVQ